MKRNAAATVVAVSLAGAVVAAPVWAADSIAVASYGGAYQDALRKAFYEPTAKALGIEVKEFTLSGLADVRTQVKAGAVEWDVVELYAENSGAAMERLRAYAIKHRRGFTLDAELRPAQGDPRWMRLIAVPICEGQRVVRLHGIKRLL